MVDARVDIDEAVTLRLWIVTLKLIEGYILDHEADLQGLGHGFHLRLRDSGLILLEEEDDLIEEALAILLGLR